MKVILKRSFSVFITIVMLLSAVLVMDITASAEVVSKSDVKYVEVTVDITEETAPTDVYKKIQAVFNEARENATPTMQ